MSGQSVYSKLKFESGVHRVQRVPATESSGRVHTSTATVAVMPEVDDVDVQIDPKARSSWPTLGPDEFDQHVCQVLMCFRSHALDDFEAAMRCDAHIDSCIQLLSVIYSDKPLSAGTWLIAWVLIAFRCSHMQQGQVCSIPRSVV